MTTDLSGNDLVNILKIVEVCTQRGAFRANELKGVGEVYEKLSKLVQQLTTNNQPEPVAEVEENSEPDVKTL